MVRTWLDNIRNSHHHLIRRSHLKQIRGTLLSWHQEQETVKVQAASKEVNEHVPSQEKRLASTDLHDLICRCSSTSAAEFCTCLSHSGTVLAARQTSLRFYYNIRERIGKYGQNPPRAQKNAVTEVSRQVQQYCLNSRIGPLQGPFLETPQQHHGLCSTQCS